MTNDDVTCDVTYKILLLGDSGVGKTSLIKALTGAEFCNSMFPTVGIDFVKVNFLVDGAKVCLQIWDTAGQERFRSITKFQYRGTKGLLLVYDVTNSKSFEMLTYWINSIEKDFDQNAKDSIPVIIVGNKCDLQQARKVSTSEGRKVADRNVASGFWETSAADGSNVRECFAQLANIITDLYNPELMDMYKYSSAIDRITNQIFTEELTPQKPLKEDSKIIKLKKKKQKVKCDCRKIA